MDKVVYLDNAATTFPKPEIVYERMDMVNRNLAFNIGRGAYKIAREATDIVDDTKTKLLKVINATEEAKVIFTPSITIALNQILQGLEWSKSSIVYVSPYEHNAVARTIHFLQKKYKFQVLELPVKQDSLEIDLDKMIYMFSKEQPTCVCVNYISNVTGYILPAKSIFDEAKKYSAVTVLDGAQAIGLLPINFKEINADFIGFAGHKTLYGPFGIAGFFMSNNAILKEVVVGGTGSNSLSLEMPNSIPEKFESSSLNIVAIAGLNAALEELDVDTIFREEMNLTRYLVEQLRQVVGIKLYMPENRNNHISIVSFVLEGYSAEDIGMILDEDYGIAVRTGYHCAPYIHKHLKDEDTFGTVRVGLGRFNTKKDIDILINALKEI